MFTRLFSLLDNVRIKQKLFLSFIAVVFVPILIVGLYLTVQFRTHVLEQAMEQSNNNVERIRTQLEDVLQRPIDISGILMSDSKLSEVVNTTYSNTYEVVQAYQQFENFKEYIKLYNEIYNIKFYTDNASMLNNWEFIQLTEETRSASWYNFENQSGLISWGYMTDETKKNESFLTLVRKVEFPSYRTSGLLVIHIDPESIRNIVKQETFESFIIDSKGIIVAAKDKALSGKKINELDFASSRTNWEVGQYEMDVDGKPSRIIVEELTPQNSQNSLKIMTIFTIDNIVSGANRISYQGFMIIVLSMVVSFVLVYATSSILSKRLMALNRDINKVSTGDLTVSSNIQGNDEIGLLSRQFNNMVSNIGDLMNRVRETENQKSQLELRQREIKLKMMASQINPHFLFNALESIRMHAHMNGQKELASIVRMLGRMIRKNLEVGTGSVTLEDELEVVRCYLEIQRFRFGPERMAFTLDIDKKAMQLLVPPLLIQPIVENAVVHGMDQVIADGEVHIAVQYTAPYLKVIVTDNGQGMDEQKLKSVIMKNSEPEEQEASRIGLRNVHQRLVMIYGEDAGLTIESSPGSGTMVSFVIHMGG